VVRFLDLGFACSSRDAQDRYKIMSNDALVQTYAVADRTDLSPLPRRPLSSSASHLHSPANTRLTLRYRRLKSRTAIMRVRWPMNVELRA